MKKRFTLFMLITVLALSACYMPAKPGSVNSDSVQTSVAQTVQVRQTQGAFETMVATLTAQPWAGITHRADNRYTHKHRCSADNASNLHTCTNSL